jgi:hypothetical protein
MSSAQHPIDGSKQHQLTREIEHLSELRNQVILQEQRVQALTNSGKYADFEVMFKFHSVLPTLTLFCMLAIVKVLPCS